MHKSLRVKVSRQDEVDVLGRSVHQNEKAAFAMALIANLHTERATQIFVLVVWRHFTSVRRKPVNVLQSAFGEHLSAQVGLAAEACVIFAQSRKRAGELEQRGVARGASGGVL